jgi:aspartate/methionine/tyrosine aminotransferase
MDDNSERFVNKDLMEIPESPISYLSRKAQNFPDAISLGRGEPDFDLPNFLKKAFTNALKQNHSHYAPTGTVPGLNEAVAKKLKDQNGIDVDPAFGVVIGSGSSSVLQAVIGTLCAPSDNIILMDPTYLMYIGLVRSMHVRPNFVPVFEQNNFAPAYEDLVKACDQKTRGIIINSPCNPTGGVFKRKQLEEIAKFAVEKDIPIVSDEIYENIVYDREKHVSIASLGPDIAARTITVNGFSKAFAMTGLRLGYAGGPVGLMRNVFKYNYFGHICANVPSMHVALEGLTNPKAKKFVRKQTREYRRRRNYIVPRLNDIGLETKMPKGAFYAFSRCDKFEKDSEKFSEWLLEKSHVITTPGSAFGPHGEGYVRFSYATKYEQIDEAMGRIEKALRKS